MSTSHAARRPAVHATLFQTPLLRKQCTLAVKRNKYGNRLCEFDGCETAAVFGSPADGIIRFCNPHKLAGHVNVQNKRCEFGGCEKYPVFGSPADGMIRFCKRHKEEGHVDVVNKTCEFDGCDKIPHFGSPVDRISQFCKTHKPESHVDVHHKQCEIDGCDKQPNFGSPVDGMTRFCGVHKQEGHVNLQNQRCESEGCETQAKWGSESGDLLSFCRCTRATATWTVEAAVRGARLRWLALVRDRGRRRGAALHCIEQPVALRGGGTCCARWRGSGVIRSRDRGLPSVSQETAATRVCETAMPIPGHNAATIHVPPMGDRYAHGLPD